MAKKSTKACEITGVDPAMARKAIAAWKAGKKPTKGFRATGYISSLPPPPLPGTQDYYRCISRWYQCYQQASFLDGYRNQIAQMQQQVTLGEINLTAYLENYAACIGGSNV